MGSNDYTGALSHYPDPARNSSIQRPIREPQVHDAYRAEYLSTGGSGGFLRPGRQDRRADLRKPGIDPEAPRSSHRQLYRPRRQAIVERRGTVPNQRTAYGVGAAARG